MLPPKLSGKTGGDGGLVGRGGGDAAQHGAQGQFDSWSFEVVRIEIGDAFLFIDLPVAAFGSRSASRRKKPGVGRVGARADAE